MTILFSLPVHESNEIVRLTIANVQQHVQDCWIVLHVSRDFKDFDWTIALLPGVFANPNSHPTRHAYSQFGIHLSNHAHAIARGIPYDTFCVLHTSEMFIRSGLEQHVAQHPYAVWYTPSTMPRHITWHPMESALRFDVFNGMVPPDHIVGSLVEGLWLSREIMQEIYAWASYCPWLCSTNMDWTFEEIALPTLANWFGSQSGAGPGRPYNAYFQQKLEIADVDAVIRGDPVALWQENCWNPDQQVLSDSSTKFSIKRFVRDITDPVRQHVIELTGLDLRAIIP